MNKNEVVKVDSGALNIGEKSSNLKNFYGGSGTVNPTDPFKRKIKPLKPIILMRRNEVSNVYPITKSLPKPSVLSKPRTGFFNSSTSVEVQLERKSINKSKRKSVNQKFGIKQTFKINCQPSCVGLSKSHSRLIGKTTTITGSVSAPSNNCTKPVVIKNSGTTLTTHSKGVQPPFNKLVSVVVPSSRFNSTSLRNSTSKNTTFSQGSFGVQEMFSETLSKVAAKEGGRSQEIFHPKHAIRPTFADDSLTNITWLGRMGIKSFMPLPLESDVTYYKIADKCKRPPYSYMVLIQLAINSTLSKRMTLKQIYQWIENTFPYFKTAKPGWKNSIRHNLSLHKIFVREVSTNSKSSYWTLRDDLTGIGPNSFFEFASYRSTNVPLQPCVGESDSTFPQVMPDTQPCILFSVPFKQLTCNQPLFVAPKSDDGATPTVHRESPGQLSPSSFNGDPDTESMSKLLDGVGSVESLFLNSNSSGKVLDMQCLSRESCDLQTIDDSKIEIYEGCSRSKSPEDEAAGSSSSFILDSPCSSDLVFSSNLSQTTIDSPISVNSQACIGDTDDLLSNQGYFFENSNDHDIFSYSSSENFGEKIEIMDTRMLTDSPVKYPRSSDPKTNLLKDVSSPTLNNSNHFSNLQQSLSKTDKRLSDLKASNSPFDNSSVCADENLCIDSSCYADIYNDHDLNGFEVGNESLDTSFSKLLDIHRQGSHLGLSLQDSDELIWPNALDE